MNEEKRWSKALIIMLFPGIIFMVFLFIYPFLYGMFLSLTPEKPVPHNIEFNKFNDKILKSADLDETDKDYLKLYYHKSDDNKSFVLNGLTPDDLPTIISMEDFESEVLKKIQIKEDKDYILKYYIIDGNNRNYSLSETITTEEKDVLTKKINKSGFITPDLRNNISDIFKKVNFEPIYFTLENYIKFFTDAWESRTIWITMSIALPATLINVILAIPFSYYMRHGIRGEKLITFFLIMPITLGTVLISEGMLSYMGPNGWLNQVLMGLHIVAKPIRFTHSYLGVLISIVLQGFPFAFLMLLGYISGINPDLEKASKMLGASKLQTFIKVLFPLLIPGIAISFCLNFVMAFSVFPSAVLLGEPSGPTRVIALAAYQWAFEKFNFNMGSSISLIMAFIELIVIMIVLLWRQGMVKGASISGCKG